MRPPRPPRDPQRGNSLVLALIVMSALATLGSLTVVSMQSNIQMSTNDRAQAIALYAAESGAAVAADFLRRNFDPGIGTISTSWGQYLKDGNTVPLVNMSTFIPSSDALPGDVANRNLFDRDQNAWYHIDLLNNRDDQGFASAQGNNDTDAIVIIRSTGHGPQGSLAIIEWTVQRVGYWGHAANAATTPHVAPTFAIPDGGVPSVPWYDLSPPPWHDIWTPTPFATFNPAPGPTSFRAAGMVLLGWHIVSL
jgi:hypothetical protein